MARTYPRIGEISTPYKPQGMCIFCGGNKANRRIEIQVNWFRGDDDVAKAHGRCIAQIPKIDLLDEIIENS